MSRKAATSPCGRRVVSPFQTQDETIRAATAAFWNEVEGRAGVHTVTIDDLLCPTGYPCPTEIDGTLIRLDGNDQTHFSEAGASWLAPRLMDRVLGEIESV